MKLKNGKLIAMDGSIIENELPYNFILIEKVVKKYRLVADRIKILKRLGYCIENVAMGSGGVLTYKRNRIQISCGYGRHNYAYVVVLCA